jgi:hypothetical protein
LDGTFTLVEQARAGDLQRAFFFPDKEPVPADIDVTWSGVPHGDGTSEQALASERLLAEQALRVDIGYYWRDIGDQYAKRLFDEMRPRRPPRVHSIGKPEPSRDHPNDRAL